jgi:MFS transporter, DHA1 family, multidrug resistance protein
MNSIQQVQVKKPLAKVWMVLILGSLTAFGPLSLDMYLPSLPLVADDLHTTASLAQLSLTFCLLGLALGQLFFGPLSDIQGRRLPLVATLIIYSVSSILCAFSPNVWILVSLRFVQGLTGAAGIVIARATARDQYSGKDLTKFVSLLALVNGAAPILAPISGGVILQFASWQTVFIILGIIGLVMFLVVALFLPETLPEAKRAEGGMLATLKTFRNLIKDRLFMGIALIQAFISTSMFAYIAGSPFVLQNLYNVTPQQFSLLFALNGIGIILSAQITGRLAGKISEVKLLMSGIVIAAAGSVGLLIVTFLHLPLIAMAIALFLVVSSVGIVSTTSFSLAMQSQGRSAGSASALLGLLPFIGGAIVSPLVGIAGEQSAVPMTIIIAIFNMGALCLYSILLHKRSSL